MGMGKARYGHDMGKMGSVTADRFRTILSIFFWGGGGEHYFIILHRKNTVGTPKIRGKNLSLTSIPVRRVLGDKRTEANRYENRTSF